MKKEYYAHGKVLLSGEYSVLDGARALALRLNVGQKLVVEKTEALSEGEDKVMYWDSVDCNGREWFWAVFSASGEVMSTTDMAVSARLSQFLKVCLSENPEFSLAGLHATIHSEFELDWGLGSSSTLISLLGQWADVSPFTILNKAFSGSGYDIAAATASQHNALIYKIDEDGTPQWQDVDFKPPFADELYFVYRGKKQNSREGISAYRSLSREDRMAVIPEINDLAEKMLSAKTLGEFEGYMDRHEEIVSHLLSLPTVKEELFADYDGGSVKSLGAWGGDFLLASGKTAPQYFAEHGFEVCLPFSYLAEK